MKRTPPPRRSTHHPLQEPPEDYQPTKAELEEEHDMPGLSLEQARGFFMRPRRHLYRAPKTRQ